MEGPGQSWVVYRIAGGCIHLPEKRKRPTKRWTNVVDAERRLDAMTTEAAAAASVTRAGGAIFASSAWNERNQNEKLHSSCPLADHYEFHLQHSTDIEID